MKKIFSILAASTLLCGVNAYASVNLGQGMIGSGLHYPASANLSLGALKDKVYYDITCKIMNPDAQAYPVVLRFDIQNTLQTVRVFLDGQELFSKQGKLSDNNEHTVTFPTILHAGMGASVVLTWLAGEGVADPVTYDCSAYPTVGLTR